MTPCLHPNIRPEVFDQTLGVLCPDCQLTAVCWSPEHCPEHLWNLSCKNESDAIPTKENREDVCGICDEPGLIQECLICHDPYKRESICTSKDEKHLWGYVSKE